MGSLDLKSIIPAIAWLIVLIANTMGHPISQMDSVQLATDLAAFIGTVNGIIKDHTKPPQDPTIGG